MRCKTVESVLEERLKNRNWDFPPRKHSKLMYVLFLFFIEGDIHYKKKVTIFET